MIQNDAAPATIVMAPSRINIHAQAEIPATPSMLEMAAAKSPPY